MSRRALVRAAIAPILTLVLLAFFFRGVDLFGVAREVAGAKPEWLALALLLQVLVVFIRARRWQFLLKPLGDSSFWNAFRATAVGFAASSLLPARAGEVIRPYFLSRHERISATGAFATVVIERVLDLLTVVALLTVSIAVTDFARLMVSPAVVRALAAAGIIGACAAGGGFVVLFLLSANPARLGGFVQGLERRLLPTVAGPVARLVERFADGLSAIRHPRHLLATLLWSLPLWLTIGTSVWAVAMAFRLPVPYPGAFLILAFLVVGVSVPTPGAIGGFHEAFRLGATTLFGVPGEAAVSAALVLHLLTQAPALLFGVYFAARAGQTVGRLRQLADERPA